MKYFFLFLIFIPNVFALAVTPISLDYGVVEYNATRQIKVFNNLEYGAEYSLSVVDLDFKVEPQKAYLENGEGVVFNLTIFPKDIGNFSLSVYVDELAEGANVVNSVLLPLTLECSKFEKNKPNILTGRVIKDIGKEKVVVRVGWSWREIVLTILIACAIICLLLMGWVGWNRRRLLKGK